MSDREFIPVKIAILTVSDSRTLEDDKSGDTLVKRLEAAGHILADRDILKDERELVSEKLREWVASDLVDVVISTGDNAALAIALSVEAHRDVYEKEIDAFSTLFTMISFPKIGTSVTQSRACAGVAGGTYLFALPGSPGACKDGWDEILVHQLDYRKGPCNFVEIMPRLEEHKQRRKS